MTEEPARGYVSLGDYAAIGDGRTVALVARDGSIDWLCLPRFDSPACFAALLGGPEHGRWLIAPQEPVVRCTRRYLPDTAVIETCFETERGAVALISREIDQGRSTPPELALDRVAASNGAGRRQSVEGGYPLLTRIQPHGLG